MITPPRATAQRPRPTPANSGRGAANKETEFGPKRSRLALFFLISAIVLASIGASLAYAVLNNIATRKALIYQSTVITTQKIPLGTAITPSMFKIVQVPTIYRPSDAAQSANEVVGRVASITIPLDVPITLDALSDVGAPESVAGQLPKGGVGFFLPDSTLVEPLPLALVNPGDYVDVYVAGYAPRTNAADSNPSLNPVISCVPILDLVGAGQNVPQNIVNSPSTGASSTPGFVLVMTPGQVSEILYFVQAGGKMALVINRYDTCGH